MHEHPILHFARDGANFSLNSDDPTVIGTRLAAEYETVRSWGLTEAHLVRAVRRPCYYPYPLPYLHLIAYTTSLGYEKKSFEFSG